MSILRSLLVAAALFAGLATAGAEEACATRVQASAADLVACIEDANLQKHLVAFQAIADANPGSRGHGNRDSATPGYLASLNYVADRMRAAGYRVSVQSYRYKGSQLLGPPAVATSAATLAEHVDYEVATNSGSGDLTAPVRPLGGDAVAASGCRAQDFQGFPAGAIALLRRGGCDLDDAVAHAVAAGAVAVAVYNAPDDAHRRHRGGEAYAAALKAPAAIPVLATLSAGAGAALAADFSAGKAPSARIAVAATPVTKTDYNLIAESAFGDPAHVVVVDAHLDSIYGAGILDNASGSATILEIALKLAHTPTTNRLRYIWFGGEEINLLGSTYYTQTLAPADLAAIAYDLDVDVTATPNYDYLIADPGHAPDAKTFPANVVPGSAPANAAFFDYFQSIGVPARAAGFGNEGTDSHSFSLVGVPNSGILTQQDCCKKAWEVKIWGGETGNYEGNLGTSDGGCVDYPARWCDNLANTSLPVMSVASKAAAAAVFTLANAPLP